MRFLVMAIAKSEPKPGVQPKPEEFAAMQKYNEQAVKAGVLLAAEGLAPRSKGARVRYADGKPVVVDGPFTESKELVAGFSIIKVNSLEEAIQWVTRAPYASSAAEMEVEIRKLMDFEDFGEMLGGEFKPNEEVAKVKFK